MATNLATRYKKDLSTDALKAKLVCRKSVLQKESRHKEFNKGRQFGLIDVNVQASGGKGLSQLKETGEEHTPKSKAKPTWIPSASVKTREQERLEMLQRYKAEKELRKLKEQREKPVFKCGRFKPEAPAFLSKESHIPVLYRPKETAVKTPRMEAPPARVTRSKAKNNLQEPVKPQPSAKAPTYKNKGCIPQLSQEKPKQIYQDKLPRRGNKEVTSVVPTSSNGRITRSAATLTKTNIPQVSRTAPAKGIPEHQKETSKGKQQRKVKKEETTALPEFKENAFTGAADKEAILHPTKATPQDNAFTEKENLPTSHDPAPAPPRRTRSFAPQNFVFKPLEGLATYKVKAMTPSATEEFLFPNLFGNPTANTSEVSKEHDKATGPKECHPKCKFFSSPKMTEDLTQEHQVPPERSTIQTESVPEEVMEASPCKGETNLQPADLCIGQTTGPAKETEHDVPYFRNILRSETERLLSQCHEWDGTTEMDIPEDAKELVRTTIGQTRLLITERFKQFEGLVDNCEFQSGEKETKCTDLDGFWDMVNFQVEDLNKKFENLRKLEGNGWQMVEDDQTTRPSKKKAVPQRATKSDNGAVEGAAARKRLAAIKAMMKRKINREEPTESQETSVEGEKVVFDGGFFQIESPAKPLSDWVPGSGRKTPRQVSRQMTPRSAAKDLLQSCAEICVLRHGTPTTSKAITPLPAGDACTDSCGVDLGSISEERYTAGPSPSHLTDAKEQPTVKRDVLTLFVKPNGSQPVDRDPFGGRTTLSQGSPMTIGKHIFPMVLGTETRLLYLLEVTTT